MELLQTERYYIVNKNEDSIWFDRKTGSLQAKTCWDMASAKNPFCLGIVYGILGKIQILPDLSSRLALITGIKEIGSVLSSTGENNKVYCITKVAFLPLTTLVPDCELALNPCHKHHTQHPNSVTVDRKNILPFGDFQPKVGLSKTFGTLKNVTSSIKSATVNAAANATGQNKNKKDIRDKERFERRILDELYKMFNEYQSFYFSYDADLTNSLQNQNDPSYDSSLPLWKKANDKFFWNKLMLSEFCLLENEISSCWLTPVIQGFVQIETVPLHLGQEDKGASTTKGNEASNPCYKLILISRRSRHRAGTRYRRRGVDEEGYVANYVETEQIFSFSHHQVSFVQVRGSVPVFWSQPGYKYRPPPRLDRDSKEIASAFKAHFVREFDSYKKVSCISLVEQSGKEKVIADAYLNHVMILDSPLLTFISFDFHEYCRGMRYENVSVLVESIEDLITALCYCWVDKQGVICRQNGVFRINCIDCLDRTNVVQTALAKSVLENQFAKLGILPPDHPLPPNCRSTLQVMWANNGDIISKQYAGTSALKGDFTRTGERNFAGLMKDGMNSANRFYINHFQDTYRQAAIEVLQVGEIPNDFLIEIGSLEKFLNIATSVIPVGPPQYMAVIALDRERHLADAMWSFSRYYLNRFKDAYRQATIDTMLGNPISEDLLSLNPEAATVASEEEEASLAQHVKHVIDDCKKLLVPDAETILGAWGLIDADPNTGDPDQTDMDIILVLTRDSYYVAQYDEEADRISNFERVSLIDLDKIEIGPYTFQGMFKQSKTHYCVRLHYQDEGQSGYLQTFRSMNIRFFNNMAVSIKTEEEIVESIKAVGDTFEVAAQMIGCDVTIQTGKLEKIKNAKRTPFTNHLNLLSPIASFTNVGTRAFSNVTSGLAKLNPIAGLLSKRTDPSIVVLNSQPPIISVLSPVTVKPKADLHVASCGIVSSCVKSEAPPRSRFEFSLQKSFSDSKLPRVYSMVQTRSSESNTSTKPSKSFQGLGTPRSERFLTASSLTSARLRKLSHSSDEVDLKGEEGDNLQRASSATELDLELPLEGRGTTKGSKTSMYSPLSPLSPLTNINKETVLAPFSVLARGVQSLAPGAGKLARGVQNIGGQLDPRKLKLQRQKQLDQDLELMALKLKCKSRIIQL